MNQELLNDFTSFGTNLIEQHAIDLRSGNPFSPGTLSRLQYITENVIEHIKEIDKALVDKANEYIERENSSEFRTEIIERAKTIISDFNLMAFGKK